MILRSIQLEGWRSFVALTKVGPFTDGLNIIHGPNGSGKSSLMMALVRGLFDSHNVGGTEIQTVRSWGRQLAPKITIEFEQDEDQFELHKQFLDSPTAKLAQKENGTYLPIAESRAADERARKILAGEASKSGATKQKHWGLAQVLWAAQGNLKIDELASGTRTTIQDALGSQITGSGTEDLENRIEQAYLQFFTRTGRLKSGASAPSVVGLQKQLDKLESDRLEVQQRLEEFDQASKRIEELRLQSETAREKEKELDAKLVTTREQVQAYQKLANEFEKLQTKVQASTATYASLVEKIDAISSTVKEQKVATIELEQLAQALPDAKKRVEKSEQDAKTAAEKVKTIRGQRNEAADAKRLAELAQKHATLRSDLSANEKQLMQIESIQKEIEVLSESRKAIVAPDQSTMDKITKVARQRDDARLKLDAAVVTVRLQLESDQAIEVTKAEETGSQSANAGDQVEIKGAPDVALRIPGLGQITATGPTDDFDSLRASWENATNSLQELTAAFETDDLSILEERCSQAKKLDDQIAATQIKLDTILDGSEVEAWQMEIESVKVELGEIETAHPQWKTSSPESAQLNREAELLEKKVAEEIEAAEEADDLAKKTLYQETRKLEKHEAQISNLETALATCEKNLIAMRKDGLSDELRNESRTKLALELDIANGKMAEVEKQIAEFGVDPAESLSKLEAQQKGFREQLSEAEKNLNTEEGRLQQLVSEAPYSKLVEVEEEITQVKRDIARDQLHLDAIRFLHKTVEEEKSDVMQSLIDPIRVRANSILQRIAGTRFDGLEFDDTLLPTSIAPRSSDEAVSLQEISGGEQEQVHFAVRMALAETAFPEGRQLVVLDDVFTYTDSTRLARITEILEESARRFQIVLLTCHPERYRDMSKAKFFDLDEKSNANDVAQRDLT